MQKHRGLRGKSTMFNTMTSTYRTVDDSGAVAWVSQQAFPGEAVYLRTSVPAQLGLLPAGKETLK